MTPGGPDPGPAGGPAHEQALETALTAFQIEVARLFFTLPASARFLLAGGADLLAQHLTERPTQDLGLFTSDAPSVATARNELEHAARDRGWTITRIHDHPEFCRLIVHGPEDLLVDLAMDAAPQQAGTASFVGPTFAPEELAARKLLALFDRAEARDFADVYVLAQRYGKYVLLERAAALDQGLDLQVLAQFMGTLSRYDDIDIPSHRRTSQHCAGSSGPGRPNYTRSPSQEATAPGATSGCRWANPLPRRCTVARAVPPGIADAHRDGPRRARSSSVGC